MNTQKMIEWIAGHHVGISSRTMWSALMGVETLRDDIPYDWDDFSRCYDLYKYAELTKEDLQKVVDKYPYYAPIVALWDDLCAIYEKKVEGNIYDVIHALMDEIMRLKGFEKVRDGSWVKKGGKL